MMSDVLDQVLYDNGINKYYCDFIDRIDAVMIGRNIVADLKIKGTYKENSATWHEYFHIQTCPINLIEAPELLQKKYETIAERKTAEQCLPLDTLIELYEYDARSLEDYSEALELDTEYIGKTLIQYQSVYGYNHKHGNYIIRSFVPFVIEKTGE